MKHSALWIALAVSACDGNRQNAAPPAPAATDAQLPADARRSQPPNVVPKPKDEAELDRLILAGYTPHADHLHPPGVKSCPLLKGGEAVM